MSKVPPDIEIQQIPLQRWLQQYQQSEAARFGRPPNLDSNLFYSLQWMGKDTFKKDFKAWAALINGEEVGWLATWWNSENTIRFRGIVVKDDYQGQGIGFAMMQSVMGQFPNAEKFILFCAEETIPFYSKLGFEIVPEFTPRPVEVFDPKTKTYYIENQELLYLMERRN